jgi:hypothetical protein
MGLRAFLQDPLNAFALAIVQSIVAAGSAR